MKKNIWQLAESLVKEEPGKLHPHVTMALDAIEERAPECMGDTKPARLLIMALMDQAGFQIPVQKKVAGILGVTKPGTPEPSTVSV